MKGNIQAERRPRNSTFNIQRPKASHGSLGRWGLKIGAGMFWAGSVSVCSVSAQDITNAVTGLAPAYGEMPPTFWEQYGTAILVAAFVCLALAGGMVWLAMCPQPPRMTPPEALAREALEKLRRQPETGQQLSEISQVLRQYVTAAFAFPPGERTTAEFSSAVVNCDRMGAESAQTIVNFLQECDRRKFSGSDANTPLNAADRALQTIAGLEKQRAESIVPNSSNARRI
jgi:hypothetical protein